MENMDMYMLNPCSNKIWYVVFFFCISRFLFTSVRQFSFFHLKPIFSVFPSLLLRFIIELCEPIQLKQLDIANFELFSSTPKDFLVSVSDR